MSKSLIARIQEDDPSFDPIRYAREAAGISAETLDAAEDRVYYDGYYGPIRPAEWREQDGREPATVTEALDILAKVAENVDDYWYDDGENFGYDLNAMVPSTDIVRAAWPFLIEIYGSLPF